MTIDRIIEERERERDVNSGSGVTISISFGAPEIGNDSSCSASVAHRVGWYMQDIASANGRGGARRAPRLRGGPGAPGRVVKQWRNMTVDSWQCLTG